MVELSTDLFFKCPNCESEYFDIKTKLPANEILAKIPADQRNLFYYPINSRTHKKEMIFVCENGHRFYFDEEGNKWEQVGLQDEGK